MSLGIQRGLGPTSPLAEQRRTSQDTTAAVEKARTPSAAAAADATVAPTVGPEASAAPRADAETVQATRQRALGLEKQLQQQLEGGGWIDAHHRKGHIGSKT
jgi:hypothetical protein